MSNPNVPREDGPALQKLFAQLEGPGQHLPVPEVFRPKSFDQQVDDAVSLAIGGQPIEVGQNEPGPPRVDIGPMNYAHKLHAAGEAAIQIVCNMAESEFAQGNPRNVPEPILGWYVMTLSYQLCVLEACGASHADRRAHAQQLRAALLAFTKYTGEYGDGVRDEVAEVLRERYRPDALKDEDASYGGVLSTVIALRSA